MNFGKSMILITGGSGLIGGRLVSDLLKSGYPVFFTCMTDESYTRIQNEHWEYVNNRQLHGIALDLEQEGATDRLISEINSRNIQITYLVNNARSRENLGRSGSLAMELEAWLKEYQLNVVVPYMLTTKLANQENSCLKSVINISSIYGLTAVNPTIYARPEYIPPVFYGTAKAALNHLTRELAVRLADRGVSVNSVTFGGVAGRADDNFRKAYASCCPAGDMLQLDDITAPVRFLLENNSQSITGHNLVVDGGWSVW